MIFVYLASIFAGSLIGIAESLNKNITEKKYSVFSYFLIQVLGIQILNLVPLLLFGKFPTDPLVYFYVLIIAILVFFANSAIIKAYKTEDISNINIITRSSLVITFISGVFLLNESITVFNVFGIVLVIIGILLIFFERKLVKPSSGLLYALTNGISYGLVAYFIKLALQYFNIPSYIFIYGIFTLIIFLFIPGTFKDAKKIFVKYKNKIIFSRVAAFMTFYLIIWSIHKGNISIVNTNYETVYLLSTVFIGILFLNEKKNIAKKLAGSLLCVLGIILLNFF